MAGAVLRPQPMIIGFQIICNWATEVQSEARHDVSVGLHCVAIVAGRRPLLPHKPPNQLLALHVSACALAENICCMLSVCGYVPGSDHMSFLCWRWTADTTAGVHLQCMDTAAAAAAVSMASQRLLNVMMACSCNFCELGNLLNRFCSFGISYKLQKRTGVHQLLCCHSLSKLAEQVIDKSMHGERRHTKYKHRIVT